MTEDFAIIRPNEVVDADLISSTVAEPAVGTYADPAVWNAATSYAADTQVTRTGVHKVFQKIGATGVDATLPEVDAALATPTKWIEVGPTNKWKAFDASFESQTEADDEIVIVLCTNEIHDTLVLLNVNAVTVQVQVADSTYNETQELTTRVVTTWLEYYFEEFDHRLDVIFQDLPLRSSNVITITITNTDGRAAVGAVLLGRAKNIGPTLLGASGGIIDYSVKQTNDFGTSTLLERPYSKRSTQSVLVPRARVDATQRLLAGFRAVPVAFVAAGGAYEALIIYGYYKSFEIVIAYEEYSLCNIEIEGLT